MEPTLSENGEDRRFVFFPRWPPHSVLSVFFPTSEAWHHLSLFTLSSCNLGKMLNYLLSLIDYTVEGYLNQHLHFNPF